MKKTMLLVLLGLSIGQTAAATECGYKSGCRAAMSTVTFFAPSLSLVSTTDTFRSEFVFVKEDAIVALETGLISDELQSVISKWRADHKEDVESVLLSDLEIVDMMMADAEENQ